MSAYALARLGDAMPHADLIDYVERIQSTLDPYGGRFLVHGGKPEAVEGSWGGSVVLIEFPDRTAARDWYESPAYQELVPLRTRHMAGDIVLVDGVAPDYDPAARADAFRRALSQESRG